MSKRCTYIVRLDDACPTMNGSAWRAIEELLDQYQVKPIVAVVPANVDPFLERSPADTAFWARVRAWQRKGWHIGLHGYRHEALTRCRGLVPLHHKSEFAGLPFEQQCARLRAAVQCFTDNGITADVWVAPFHTFDSNTLRALMSETRIKVVSDGIAQWPFAEAGFFWIPQQLWVPTKKSSGIWTICLHPNDTSQVIAEQLKALIASNPAQFLWNMEQLRADYGGRKRNVRDRVAQHTLVLSRMLEGTEFYRIASRLKRSLSGSAQ